MASNQVNKELQRSNNNLRTKLFATYDSLRALKETTDRPTTQIKISLILDGIDGKLDH